MLLYNCRKAALYDSNENYLCDAEVFVSDKEAITLSFSRPYSQILRSEMTISFFDRFRGVITCECLLSGYEEYITPKREQKCRVHCEVVQVISTIERRSDIKVPINTEVDMLTHDESGNRLPFVAKINNISAGGLCLSSSLALNKGQIIHFTFVPLNKNLHLSAEILRTQEDFTYGARFINITSSTESELRRYVYRVDLKFKKYM
ncbi:hypothetical protein M2454_000894 [Aequitasia blattaphilus]|uniref:PilZ domain-containing protein n=1 Tax=Aequitasia blattaphilus TaxID=2949332 RepID=A0ABT1EC28_9FIRM|nr:PilZ domain-containing protein [Aequitasia blattaphilus]MCP1102497.1 PilZ domain-containing protein [Aequitasia blattaphilus]MCR8615137.1 PilZ domain-containing protein [Aequitasia blattaphilus]